MSFSQYASTFKEKAILAGYSADNIQRCLNYAKPLYDRRLPIIYNTTNLSALVGYNKTYLKKAALYTEYFYRSFDIRKKDGTPRNIKEPLPSLKEIQLWILQNILYEVPISKFAKAYIKKRSIKENIRFHIDKNKILTLDIENFFSSIKRISVEKIFRDLGYSSNISNLLGKICCLDDMLPQGAPTSPYLSNIYMFQLDAIIAKFCTNNKLRFTRYADDMIFSGDDFDENIIIAFVKAEIEKFGLKIKEDKTAVMRRNVPQIVTGVLVNKKPQMPRQDRDNIRLEIYYIKTFGLAGHLQHTKNKRANYLRHLIGKINYALFLNPQDKELLGYLSYIKDNLTAK